MKHFTAVLYILLALALIVAAFGFGVSVGSDPALAATRSVNATAAFGEKKFITQLTHQASTTITPEP